MKIAELYISGLRRIGQSPSLVVWVYLASLILVVPLGLAMRDQLSHGIGGSLAGESLRRGFDFDWYGEFRANSPGIAETFGPSVVGIFAVLTNLEKLFDGSILEVERVILLAGIAFLLAWAFFGGGVIARYTRPDQAWDRRVFFGESAVYFFRFVRVLIISVLLYVALFAWVASPLWRLIEKLTRDVTQERVYMLYTIAFYGIVAAGIALITLLADYAKIAMVVETRASAIFAFIRAARFVFANPMQTFGLYLWLVLTGVLLVGIYWLVAPGPDQQIRTTVALAFLIGQVYFICRIVLKLWFLSSQAELFRSRPE